MQSKKGWTIKKLSQITKIDETSISRYERGMRKPYLETISKLSKALNTTIEYLSDYDHIVT